MPRIAAMFVAFATRTSSHLPVDTPVRLYLSNKYEKTIPAADVSQHSRWRLCDRYGDHPCPMSATDVIATTGADRVIVRTAADPCLSTLASRAISAGGTRVVVLSPRHPTTCGNNFAVQIWSNDVGQITAVNLLLGSGS
jgi:hypothetical protein